MNLTPTRNAIAGLAALVVSACATTQATPTTKALQAEAQSSEEKYVCMDSRRIPDWVSEDIPIEKVLKDAEAGERGGTLGVQFGYGYIWDNRADAPLRIIAGVYAGTTIFDFDDEGGYDVSGGFNESACPTCMEHALQGANGSIDHFVSLKDALRHLTRLAEAQLDLKRCFDNLGAPPGDYDPDLSKICATKFTADEELELCRQNAYKGYPQCVGGERK